MDVNWPNRPVMVDCGSGVCKAGFGGDFEPTVFPTVIGRPKYEQVMNHHSKTKYFIGHEAQLNRGVLHLSYPVQRGKVVDWDDMEIILRYCFNNELRINPEETPVFFTEPPLNPKVNREYLTQLLFETFHVPSFALIESPVLVLNALGQRTGIVLESGHGVTCSVPVYDGYSIPHAIHRLDLAGRDLTHTACVTDTFPSLKVREAPFSDTV